MQNLQFPDDRSSTHLINIVACSLEFDNINIYIYICVCVCVNDRDKNSNDLPIYDFSEPFLVTESLSGCSNGLRLIY